AVITLALAIGANAAIYSAVSGLILDPLPWDNSGEVVSISETNLKQNIERGGVSSSKYLEWVEQARSLRAIAATRFQSFNLTDGDQNMLADGFRVTPSALAVAGIRPPLGRGFLPEDVAPGAAPVVLLTHGLWARRYGSDPDIVGRSIEINGEPATVVGVLGPLQWLPTPWADMLAPLRLERDEVSRTDHSLSVYGWLAPGFSIRQAQSEMSLIAQRLAEQFPDTDAGWGVRLDDARTLIVQGSSRSGVWLWMGLAGFVLLIACANVANLQLARGGARQKELSIRAALGASRARIVRQLLTESALLALVALPLALLVTRWVLDYLLSFTPGRWDYMPVMLRLDTAVFVFTAVASALTILVFGLIPALNVSQTNLGASLKEGGERGSTSGGAQRLRSALVVTQIALALCLLVSAGLFLERFSQLQQTDAGFRLENLLATSLDLPSQRYPEPEHWRQLERELLARVEVLPGVRSAASASWTPFSFGGGGRSFGIQGRALGEQDERPSASWSNVSTGYFETLGVRLVEGRLFDEGDREGSVPVVIVNQAFVRRYFTGESPLGARLLFDGHDDASEIVGVVSDSAQYSFTEPVFPQLYEPSAQQPGPTLHLLLRTESDPFAVGGALRSEVRGIDPLLSLYVMETLLLRTRDSLWPQRLSATVVTLVAVIALSLAIVGVYGVVSYSTSQRTAEFGIRAALGAEPGRIARLVVRQASVLAAWGSALGLLLAWWVARLLSSLLPEMPGFRPLTFAGLALVLAVAALLASALPALRATRTDPMIPLRAE
ncbi:MAG: ABC transporter permease, partial [Myxococcota bacterium]